MAKWRWGHTPPTRGLRTSDAKGCQVWKLLVIMNDLKNQNIPLTWPACWQWCQQHAGLHCTHVLFCHDNTCEAFLSGPFLYPKNTRFTPHDQMCKIPNKLSETARLSHASYLDVNDVTLLVDAHVGWQGDRACWVKNTISSSAQAEVYKALFIINVTIEEFKSNFGCSPCLRNGLLNMYLVPLLLPFVFVMVAVY